MAGFACQEGGAAQPPHEQAARPAPTADVLSLLRRRSMPIAHIASAALRESFSSASPGSLAIVHDADRLGELPSGKPLPPVLAATNRRRRRRRGAAVAR